MTEAAASPDEIAARHERGEIQLVDVRTPEEWDAGHVPGSRHIPAHEVAGARGELEQARPVVFLCRGGDRSHAVAEAFAASGWDATSLEGGIVAWQEQGLPLEPDDARVVESSGLPPA